MIQRILRRHLAATHASDISGSFGKCLSAGAAEPLFQECACPSLGERHFPVAGGRLPSGIHGEQSGLARFAGQLWPLLARVVSRAENDGNPFSGASFYYPGGRKFLSGPAPRGI